MSGSAYGVQLINKDKTQEVKDGENISLGDKSLQFIHAPWVHWPDTMVTYLIEDRILFSAIFWVLTSQPPICMSRTRQMLEAAKRYYAEIMMPFRVNI